MLRFEEDAVASMSVEELALEVLRYVAAAGDRGVNRQAITSQGRMFRPSKVAYRVSEAWDHLVRLGLIAEAPGVVQGYFFATERGRQLLNEPDALARHTWRYADTPLHPRLNATIRSLVVSGPLDMALVAAMREVEIRVGELAPAIGGHGASLLRSAFNPENGPLADGDTNAAERGAMMALFWGAYGVFRNPAAHRNIDLDDTAVFEAILLADLLHRLLDRIEQRMRAHE